MSTITVDELITKVGWKVDEASAAKAVSSADSLASRIGGAFRGIASMILPAAGVGGLAAMAYTAVTTTANLERLQAQYEVMLGSAEKGAKMIKDIQELAASTPLNSLGISSNVKTLLAFGVAGDKAIDTIKMLGDVAGGDQERLSSLTLAYSQTMSAGKLMGQDLLQYVNQGFNPLNVMRDNLKKFGLAAGTTSNDLRDMMSKGKISAAMVSQAFELVTAKGGMFYQNMEKQSQTLGGLWSTLLDNIQQNLVKVMQPLLPYMKDMIKAVDFVVVNTGTIMGFLAKHMGMIKASAIMLLGLLTAIYGPAMIARITSSANALKLWAFWQAIATKEVVAYGTRVTVARTATEMWAFSFGKLKVAATAAWAAMNMGITGVMVSLGALVAVLGVVYYAYTQINEAADQRQKDEEARAARERTSVFEQQDANLKVRKMQIEGILGDKTYMAGSRGQAEKKGYERELEAVKRALVVNDKNRKAALSYEKSIAPKDAFSDLLAKQVQTAGNGQKVINNNIKNDITIPLTVDDKGQTQLSALALDTTIKSAVRSAFNTELINLTRGV